MDATPIPLSPDQPDDVLLSALSHEPGLTQRVQNEAHAAYLAARGQAGCDYVVLDARWRALLNTLAQASQVSAACNPNSVTDKAARLGALRAQLITRDHFHGAVAMWPKAPKPVPTGLYAARLMGHEWPHPLEAYLQEMPDPEPHVPNGPATFEPTKVRGDARRNVQRVL